LEGVLL
jgi:hypothetical protein